MNLLPCPFCGNTDAFVERLDNSSAYVLCQGDVGDHGACLARGPIAVQDDDGEELPGGAGAIRAWNQRAHLDTKGGQSVEEMIDDLGIRAELETQEQEHASMMRGRMNAHTPASKASNLNKYGHEAHCSLMWPATMGTEDDHCDCAAADSGKMQGVGSFLDSPEGKQAAAAVRGAQEQEHDNLRDQIGQALNDALQSGAENPDWCDSRNVDYLADAVIAVLQPTIAPPHSIGVEMDKLYNLLSTEYAEHRTENGVIPWAISALRQTRFDLEPFIVGNQYRTQRGTLVTILEKNNKGHEFETVVDDLGHHLYTKKNRGAGRVTGTPHDFSCPDNILPLYTIRKKRDDA